MLDDPQNPPPPEEGSSPSPVEQAGGDQASSLDPAILDELRALQEDADSPLFDEAPLDGADVLLDLTPLAPDQDPAATSPFSWMTGPSTPAPLHTPDPLAEEFPSLDSLFKEALAEEPASAPSAPKEAPAFDKPPEEETPEEETPEEETPSASLETGADWFDAADLDQLADDLMEDMALPDALEPEDVREDSAPQSQEAPADIEGLDAIIQELSHAAQAEEAATPAPEPAPEETALPPAPAIPPFDFDEEEPPLDQAILDSLFEERKHEQTPPAPQDIPEASDPTQSPGPSGPAQNTPLSQDELDILLNSPEAAATQKPNPVKERLASLAAEQPQKKADETQPKLVSQEELNKAFENMPKKKSGFIPYQAVAEELQALREKMEKLPEKPAALPEQGGPASLSEQLLSQEELDRMLGGTKEKSAAAGKIAEKAAPPEQPTTKDGPMSQADLDKLLAEQSATPEPETPAKDGPMSQADLDKLLAEQSATPEPETPADDGPMSQADLDKLLAEQSATPEPEAPADDGPMSQADLDKLLAEQSATPEPEAPADDGPMSQADLDKLLAEQSATPEPETPADDGPMSQADLDKLLAEQSTTPEPEAPADDGPMSQADLDKLLAEQSATPEPEAPADDGPMSQADLDKLLAEQSATPEPEAPADDGPMSQADLDKLLAEQSATPEPEAPADDGPMSQADLDKLLAEQSAAPEPEAPADDGPMSQADLDKLLAEQSATPEPEAPADDGPMSQADLDKLLAEQSAAPEPEAPADDGPMSQADLDKLLAEQSATPEPEAPAKDGPMSQADLDKLLAEQSATPEPEAPADDGPMSQADLDKLLAEQSATPEPETPADDGPMSQADLDQLLAEQSAAPESEAAAPADEGTLSQEDLDQLLAAQAPQEAPEQAQETTDEGTLSQEDLDQLLAAQASQEAPDQAPETTDEGTLSQEDLDQLIAAEKTEEDAATPETDDGALDQEALDKLLATAQEAPPTEEKVDQADIDALLDGAGEDEVLDGSDVDELLVDKGAEDTAPGGDLDQSMIDSLMADLGEEEEELDIPAPITPPAINAPKPAPEPETPQEKTKEGEAAEDDISQDMIDALIAAAGGEVEEAEEAKEEVASENIAAAASAPADDLVSHEELNQAVEKGPLPAPQKEPQPAKPLKRKTREKAPEKKAPEDGIPHPNMLLLSLRSNLPRVAATLLIGAFTALSTFTWLYINRETIPPLLSSTGATESSLEMAIQRAKEDIKAGDYLAALQELEAPLGQAAPGPLRTEAEYLQLEAQYKSYIFQPYSPQTQELLSRIETVVDAAPDHARAPEALYWKAQLYELDQLPFAAQEVYEELINHYPDAPQLDKVLLDAAKLAHLLRNPRQAAEYSQRLLQQYPNSPESPQARLVLGDAYAMAGMYDDARTLYVRTAQGAPNDSIEADAYLRLGRLAYDQRQYDAAARNLETRLKNTTTLEGNDAVYLLLAQTYRQLEQLEKARDTLNDLISFFPETDATPDALVEFSQVLEDLGDRDAALLMAQQAVARYPDNPDALKNKGFLLGLNGNAFGAASALVEADNAGANDPELLLTAARYFRTDGLLNQADDAYTQLKRNYPRSSQAITGSIEQAGIHYERGKINQAVEQLEDLLLTTRENTQRAAALAALTAIYSDLGLNDQVKEYAIALAGEANEAETLADAAAALLQVNALEEAQNLIERLDLAQVTNATAYNLLMQLGQALLQVDPRRGLEKMEQAHFAYPQARSPQKDQKLLETYLAANRTAAARRMVMELSAETQSQPAKLPYLIDAAITWADYLYDKGDFRAAADAYAIATEATLKGPRDLTGAKTDPRWAKFQRANALLELADFKGSLDLYSEIAATDAPWAKEAQLKAEYAKLEQRLRGAPATETRQAG